MSDAVVSLKKFKFFTGWKIVALPAAVESFLSRAVSNFAFGRAAVAPAGPFATHLHHRPQQAVALIIVLEFLEKGHLRQYVRHLVESVMPQFFSKVSGQVCHSLGISGTIPAIIRNNRLNPAYLSLVLPCKRAWSFYD